MPFPRRKQQIEIHCFHFFLLSMSFEHNSKERKKIIQGCGAQYSSLKKKRAREEIMLYLSLRGILSLLFPQLLFLKKNNFELISGIIFSNSAFFKK